MQKKNYRLIRENPLRRLTKDALYLSKKRKFVTTLFDVDITEARKQIQSLRKSKNANISFFSYIIFSLGKITDKHKQMTAMRGIFNRIFLFDNIDLLIPVETENEGEKILVPKIIRSFNRKSVMEIDRELRQFDPAVFLSKKNVKFFLHLPKPLRLFYYKITNLFPGSAADSYGHLMIVNDGVFGVADVWTVGIPFHTTGIFSGTFKKKVVLENRQFVEKTFLNIIVVSDHLVIEGRHIMKFVKDFKFAIQNSYKELI